MKISSTRSSSILYVIVEIIGSMRRFSRKDFSSNLVNASKTAYEFREIHSNIKTFQPGVSELKSSFLLCFSFFFLPVSISKEHFFA